MLHPSVRSILGLALVAMAMPRIASAASADDVVKAFEKDKDYVQPFATLYGSMTNSGWYQSSSVPATFSFYIGIPLSASLLADADRSYKGTWIDTGCVNYHKDFPSGAGCTDRTDYTAPTLFGKGKGPVLYTHAYNPNTKTLLPDPLATPKSDGNSTMASFNWMPFGEPQIGLSFFHTEVKLRYLAIPTIGGFSFSLPGLGLQHDLSSFLPPIPVDVSVAANWTWLNAEWQPKGDIDGKLKLNGTSAFYGLLVGKTFFHFLEVFGEAGWETASLKSGGSLVIHGKNGDPDENVNPGLTIDGRNGFRMALNLAFHVGYDAVLGQNIGAEFGNQAGLLAYRFKP